MTSVHIGRIQSRRREAGLIGSVGKILTLDGDSVIIDIVIAAFALRTPGEPVACIDLHTRLIGLYDEGAARCRIKQFGYRPYLARGIGVDGPAVVITFAIY